MLNAALCGNFYLIPIWSKRLSYQLLVVVADTPICLFTDITFSRIKEGIAHFHSLPNRVNGCVLICCSSVCVGKSHATQTNRRHLQVFS